MLSRSKPLNEPGESIVPLVVMTHRTSYGRLLAADEELNELDSLRGPRIRMPVSD